MLEAQVLSSKKFLHLLHQKESQKSEGRRQVITLAPGIYPVENVRLANSQPQWWGKNGNKMPKEKHTKTTLPEKNSHVHTIHFLGFRTAEICRRYMFSQRSSSAGWVNCLHLVDERWAKCQKILCNWTTENKLNWTELNWRERGRAKRASNCGWSNSNVYNVQSFHAFEC